MIYVANKNIGMTGGGDAVVAMEIIDSLNSNGLEVVAVSMRYHIPDYLNEKYRNVKHFAFPFIPVKKNYSSQKFGSIRYAIKRMESDLKQMILTWQFNKNPPNIIISNDIMIGRYLLNKYQGQVKFIQVVHATPDFFEEFKGEALDEHIHIINNADSAVFVSEECRKKWLPYTGIDKNKTHCIYNCSNEENAKKLLRIPKTNVRKRLNLSSDKFYLVSVASFNHEKGLDLILDAAPELKKIAPNLEILLIGSDQADYADYLKKRAVEEGKSYVNVLGFKENAMEYIYASDAFILPSRVEALGLVILEAMILKTPVFASKVGGIPELIDDDKSGLLFESENVHELIQCFKKIYLNQDDCNRYVEQASKEYWNNFSKDKFTERYLELVKNLIH